MTSKEQANRGPLWPYMIQAKDDDGQLVWAWRGPEGVQGPWRESQAAALADLHDADGVPADVKRAAASAYHERVSSEIRKITAKLNGPGWDL